MFHINKANTVTYIYIPHNRIVTDIFLKELCLYMKKCYRCTKAGFLIKFILQIQ